MEAGFIQGLLEIKCLLLYILARINAPIDLDTLTDIALCDDGVSYFDFSTALAEIIGTSHVLKENDRYSITQKGRNNGSAMEEDLPYSVRLRCDRRIAEVNAIIQKEKLKHISMEQTEKGDWHLTLGLDNESGLLFSLDLFVPYKSDAERITKRFQKDPQVFYDNLCK